jgi:hypothetical protein
MSRNFAFATIKYKPRPTQSSFSRPQLDTVVIREEGDRTVEHKLYIDAGNPTDWLDKGDVVGLQYSGGKWRLCQTQAPELLQKLEQRMTRSQSPAPTASPEPYNPYPQNNGTPSPRTAPTTSPKQRPDPKPKTEATPQAIACFEDDCNRMIKIFVMLRNGLPNTPDECVQAMACTIWVERNKR